MDYSSWLTQDQAATAIGVARKTVERWADAGKLQKATWSPQGRGPARVVYHPDDVARLAAARRPAPAAFVLPAEADLQVRGAGSNGHGAADRALTTVGTEDPVRLLFAAALRAVMSQTSQTSPALFLSLPEAAGFTGLSQACLRRRIDDGTLPAVRDRGWRIRRRDLEAL